MAKYFNTKTGRIVNIKSIETLPEDNQKDLKPITEEVKTPEVIKMKKNAKD